MKHARLVLLVAFFIALPLSASAATISALPGKTTISTGDIVTVQVVTNTQGEAVNQGSATLQFPAALLQVVSVSKSGSIFSLWVEEPTYSNSAGTVSFVAGAPNPGYTGSSGSIISVTFVAKAPGTASISFGDAAIRANDGSGTDVLRGRNGTQITVASPVAAPIVPQPTPAQPNAPVTTPTPAVTQPTGSRAITGLVSSTHPDQNKWYANATALISWTLPPGATAVQTIASLDPDEVPSVVYAPAISLREITDLEDGTWFFKVRARVDGTYGPVSTYQLLIDTTAPTFQSMATIYDAAKRAVVLTGTAAEDSFSGIAGYELTIGDSEPIALSADALASGSYSQPFKRAGVHTVLLTAIDGAGNRTTVQGSVSVPESVVDQVIWDVFGIDITLLTLILAILLVSLASFAAAAAAWYKLFTFKHDAEGKADKRNKLLHRAMTIFKQDLEEHIQTLAATASNRKLTAEEAKLGEDLAANVDDMEKFLKKEFKKLT